MSLMAANMGLLPSACRISFDENHPHAASALTENAVPVANYTYDANGNMTCCTENGITYKQDYNVENRISAIHKMNGSCATGTVLESWVFGYDGDGGRVSTLHFMGTTLDSETKYFFGGAYETRSDGTNIKHYSFAGQTIAMNDGTGLQYFLTDHLGSVVATTDSTGTLTSQQRYLPFGGARTDVQTPGVPSTDYGYTGQRNLDPGMGGLMDYKARFYSPYINRFIQPDTLIPSPANPQAFNRYSYVLNSPVNFNDPTGHMCEDPEATAVRGGGKPKCDGSDKVGERSLIGGLGKTKSDNKGAKIPRPTGNNVEFNITAGIPLENADHATIGLLYLSLGMVTDEDGGVQFYYTTLDQIYTPGSSEHMGGFSGENGEKDSAYGLGFGGSRGIIFGDNFRTDKFLGKGDSFSLGVLPLSGGYFNPRDKTWTGVELGGGGGFTMGSVSTDTKRPFDLPRIQLPPNLISACRMMGQCGMIASIPPIP